jgi:acyl transferase domain-containing protein
MYAADVRHFLEVGPRNRMTVFIADTLGKRPHLAVPLDVPRRPGLEQLCRALAMLVAHGVPVDLPALYRRRQPRPLDLHAAPLKPPRPDPFLEKEIPALRLSDEAVARWQEAAPSTSTPAPVTVPAPLPPPTAPAPPAPLPADLRTQRLADYQRTMRQFLESQQQVTLACFQRGGARAPTAQPVDTRNGFVHDAAPAVDQHPFLETILTHVPDQQLLAECELDVARHHFLLDHTFFGRHLADHDASLTALPVMPLAMMLELMAEAATVLRPGWFITSVRDVRMHRWLAFETPTRRVRLEATA